MSIEVPCRKCGAVMRLGEESSGSVIRCPKCRLDQQAPDLNPYRSPVELPATISHRPQAVQVASRRSRLAAALLDAILALITAVLTIVFYGRANIFWDSDTRVSAYLPLWLLEAIQAISLSICGQSLGKILMQIRVARLEDNGNPGFLRTVLIRRWLVGFLYLAPAVGRLILFVDLAVILRKPKRCIHDLIAGTHVIATKPLPDDV